MKRSAIGIILVALGSFFLLRNLGWIPDISFYVFRWPNILFLIAIGFLISGKPKPALIFVLIGGVFWTQQYFYFNWAIFWPVVMIIIGVLFFIQYSGRRSGSSEEDSFDETTIFSGSKKKFTSANFSGGKITTIFGGTELDLRDAKPTDDALIDVFCMFGGAEIKVPEDWKVNNDTTPIFGGVSDERNPNNQTGPAIKIKGFVMFGGVEVKS